MPKEPWRLEKEQMVSHFEKSDIFQVLNYPFSISCHKELYHSSTATQD